MPPTRTLAFVAANRRFLAFGFFVALSSSFGQTYFIGVFGPSLRDAFAMGHTEWGTVYLAGTLASAALLPWTGKQLDRFDLRHYTAFVFALLAIACVAASAAHGPLLLVLAVFALRHAGQGLASHVALTSMARYFDRERGRAIAVASMGFAVGEAFLPFVAVLLIAGLGWRATWVLAALAALLVVMPAALWLLRGHGERHRAHERLQREPPAPDAPRVASWTRAEVLRDARFYLLLPALLTPSLIVTALFFHHLGLADTKGWSHAWLTGNYVLYAVATVATVLVIGPLIDRFGALKLLPALLVPLTLALVAAAALDGRWAVLPYLALLGASSGMVQTLGTAVWPELYGVTWLGSIKSLATALKVFSSALGPVSAGLMMDAGIGLERVCVSYVALTVLATALMLVGLRRRPAPGPTGATTGARAPRR